MTERVEIQCINKSGRAGEHEMIHSVGGLKANGALWMLSHDDVIQDIESNNRTFFVRRLGSLSPEATVIVVTSQSGQKYIKTQGNAEHANNLLNLPDCP